MVFFISTSRKREDPAALGAMRVRKVGLNAGGAISHYLSWMIKTGFKSAKLRPKSVAVAGATKRYRFLFITKQ